MSNIILEYINLENDLENDLENNDETQQLLYNINNDNNLNLEIRHKFIFDNQDVLQELYSLEKDYNK